jgi:polar amino acid transport system permease protein
MRSALRSPVGLVGAEPADAGSVYHLPQALQRVLPPLAGQFISVIEDSAIVSAISISELTFHGLQLMASTYITFEIWITIGAMYGFLTLGCSLALAKLERSVRH